MKKDMNFFAPFSAGKRGNDRNTDKYVYIASIVVALFIVVSFGYFKIATHIQQSAIDDFQEKLSEPEVVSKIEESNNINRKTDIANTYTNGLNNVLLGVKSASAVDTNLVNDIKSTLPSQISITNLSIKPVQINITAEATDRVAIAEFEHNLRELDEVLDVYIGSITGQDEMLTFDVNVTLKGVL